MRDAQKHGFMLFGLGSHVFQLVEWALIVGAIGYAAERLQSENLQLFSFILRFFVMCKAFEIVFLIGEHYTGIHSAKEFEEKLKGNKPSYVIVLAFFGYLIGMAIVGTPAIFLTEELLEVARQLAEGAAPT